MDAPTDPSPTITGPSPPEARPGSTSDDGPNFCPACGAAWLPGAAGCSVCLASAARRTPLQVADAAAPLRPIRNAILLYFLVLGSLLGGGVAGHVLGVASDLDPPVVEVLAGVFGSALSAIVVALWSARHWSMIRPLLATSGGAAWYPLAVLLASVTFAVASVATGFLVKVLAFEEIGYVSPILDAGLGWPMVILLVCVEPAVMEELAFRGFILTALQRVLSNRDAIIVSSLMFMVIHLAVPSFPHLFLIGLALGYVRVRSGSLYPAMVLHFMHNLTVALSESWGG